jgi:hypothetical protein
MVTLENSMKRDIFRRLADTAFTLDFIGRTVGRGWLAGATASERDLLYREITRNAPAAKMTMPVARLVPRRRRAGRAEERRLMP